MHEFTKHMVVIEEYPSLGRDDHLRIYRNFPIGAEGMFSIQASGGHYCTPRRTIPLEDYEAVEIAFLLSGSLVSGSTFIEDDSLCLELEEYFDGSVYGFVSVDLVSRIFDHLFDKKG